MLQNFRWSHFLIFFIACLNGLTSGVNFHASRDLNCCHSVSKSVGNDKANASEDNPLPQSDFFAPEKFCLGSTRLN